jgi:molybdopterin-containing oxidoreductase family iron-sulfur binding subunit
MKAGTVDTLVICGANPAYDAPADLDFKGLLAGFKGVSFHHGLYVDETAVQATWHVNAAHFLEGWGDVRGHDGTVALQQPLIAPLYNGITPVGFAATLARMAQDLTGIPEGQQEITQSDPQELVKATWRRHFDQTVKSADFEAWWQHTVRDGVVPNTTLPTTQVATPVRLEALTADKAFAAPTVPRDKLEVQFRPDPCLYDGRFANNGWLQELPKPITKLTWDNAAIVSPATAAKLGAGTNYRWTGGEHGRAEVDVVKLKVGDKEIGIAVWTLPGHADDTVTLYLGHGRERAGGVGTDKGFKTYQLRTSSAPWAAGGAEARKTGETYFLACTQGQYTMENRRPVRHATTEQFERDEEFAQVPPASPAEYKELRALTPGTPEDWERLHGHDGKPYPVAGVSHAGHAHAKDEKKDDHGHEGHDKRIIPLSLYPNYPQRVAGDQASKTYRRWGMVIDLGACTGCTTCVVACQAENNIPVVGKHEVTRGRAMHWLRIDRYFSIPGTKTMSDELSGNLGEMRNTYGNKAARAEKVKDSAAIRTHFQPVMCVQCEKAPCEVVCPVGATVHSADGLNDMVYNRCVGTRYCSNNCPYKVRRFNFLQYADYHTESLKLLNNPEVTVRQRGVMEKCTYCVQRIRNAEIEAEREFATRAKDDNGRPKIKDGEVVTACQAACPTNAIQFGDLNDKDAVVLRWKAEVHNYGLLAELNTMPRTSHIAQIRNPNKNMPQGA